MIATPVVSVPYASSQVPADVPVCPVTAGDTASMSNDIAVNPNPLLPGAAYASTTGIGGGHTHFGGAA